LPPSPPSRTQNKDEKAGAFALFGISLTGDSGAFREQTCPFERITSKSYGGSFANCAKGRVLGLIMPTSLIHNFITWLLVVYFFT